MTPFLVSRAEEKPIFSLQVLESLKQGEDLHPIKDVDTGNGITSVWRDGEASYQFLIKNINNLDCCLLIANSDFSQCRCALTGTTAMRHFGLQNAIMLCYAFSSARYDAILIHASVVRKDNHAYAFTAPSGTGKSTQVSNWIKAIPGCDLLNDDNPVIRVVDGEVYIYGSPWSGKTPCYRQIRAKLGALTLIKRATTNSIEQQKPLEAFSTLMPSISTMKWDTPLFSLICDTLSLIIKKVNIYTLHCLPDLDSARLCHERIANK